MMQTFFTLLPATLMLLLQTTPIHAATPPATPTPPATTPASATPPATPAPAVSPAPPAPAATTTPPASTPTTSEYKAEIEQINSALQTLSSCKSRMKELLASVDADITTAKTQAAEARKTNLEVLKQSSVDQAKTLQAEVQQKGAAIGELRKKVIDATAKTFQEEVTKMQAAMKQLTDLISQLKAKGAVFQNTQQPAAPIAAPTASTAPGLPSSWVAGSSPAAAEEPTRFHQLFRRVVAFAGKAARVCYAIYQSAKAAIWGQELVNNQPIAPAGPAAVVPTGPAAAPTPAPTTPLPLAAALPDDGLAALADEQHRMIRTVAELEHTIQQLGLTLASNPVIRSAMQSDIDLFLPLHQAPGWRQTAHDYFETCLDGATWLYRSVQRAVAYAYGSFVQPAISKVQADVTASMNRDRKATTAA